jgi:RibD domain-containing protein
MRRIIAFDHVSADGYFADKDGNLDWVVPEDGLNDQALKNTLTSALAQHGLIDEYQFAVALVMLGQGRSLISGVTRVSQMSLTESRALPQGNRLLRYELAH